jgi:hypothetical protein
MDRAFSPQLLLARQPGAAPQAVMERAFGPSRLQRMFAIATNVRLATWVPWAFREVHPGLKSETWGTHFVRTYAIPRSRTRGYLPKSTVGAVALAGLPLKYSSRYLKPAMLAQMLLGKDWTLLS